MKTCPNCQQQMDDNLAFCMNCGTQLPAAEPAPAPLPVPTPPPASPYVNQAPPQDGSYANPVPPQSGPYANQIPPQNGPYGAIPPVQPAPVFDPYDHTAEFTPKDISDNKVISMLVYLMGAIGIVIALLAANSSPYAAFHVRQALKFTVVTILLAIVTAVLCWTIIVPIVAGIAALALLVVKIICFFQICKGKAVEPYIIRSFTFLK